MKATAKRKLAEEIAEEARAFHDAWCHASRYAKAGNPEMAKRIIDAAPVSKRKHSPEEREQLLQWAVEAMHRCQVRDAERRLQGLPPLETKPPDIH